MKKLILFFLSFAPFFVYGQETSISKSDSAVTVTDIDGNVYQTVTIGAQTWMAENLKTTKYCDGVSIPYITDNANWARSPSGYCWYENDISNKEIYGALYKWYTVSIRKICPTGWHVPTDKEWTTLSTFLGGESVSGGKMKKTGMDKWEDYNTGATNESGFSGLPGGCRDFNGMFLTFGYNGHWWTSTESSSPLACHRFLGSSYTNLCRGNLDREYGCSVRCVRDF